jgi:hypothetical protein
MTIPNYIDNISRRYKQGNTTKHTFRGDLQQLIENLLLSIRSTNEPKHGTPKSKAERLSTTYVFIRFLAAPVLLNFLGLEIKPFYICRNR